MYFIKKSCFIDLKSLTILNLENNYLLDFSFNEFPSIMSITSNNLESNLVLLNYKNNRIDSIQSLSNPRKSMFDKVTLMDFSFSFLTSFETSIFFTETNVVKEMYLNNNCIKSISSRVFSIFRSLITLNLEYNQISSTEPYSFYLFNFIIIIIIINRHQTEQV
jgi:hypothetical protein